MTTMSPLPEISRLKHLLRYEPETGLLWWRERRSGIRFDRPAGCRRPDGYVVISVDSKNFHAHRIAWALFHGSSPLGVIDHIDGDPSNNAIINLRQATQRQNCQNRALSTRNRHGLKGVSFCRQTGKFKAAITINGTYKNLGRHPTAEIAHAAYREAASRAFGEFAKI